MDRGRLASSSLSAVPVVRGVVLIGRLQFRGKTGPKSGGFGKIAGRRKGRKSIRRRKTQTILTRRRRGADEGTGRKSGRLGKSSKVLPQLSAGLVWRWSPRQA